MSELRPINQVNYTTQPPLVGATKMSQTFDIINSHSIDLNTNVMHYNDVKYYNTFYDYTNPYGHKAAVGGNSLSANFAILEKNSSNYGPNVVNRTKSNQYNHIHYVAVESLYGTGLYDIEMTMNIRVRCNGTNLGMHGSIYFDTIDSSNLFNSTTIQNDPWYNIRTGFQSDAKSVNYSENEIIWSAGDPDSHTNFTMTYAIQDILINNTTNTHFRFILDGFMSVGNIAIQNSSILWKIIKRGI